MASARVSSTLRSGKKEFDIRAGEADKMLEDFIIQLAKRTKIYDGIKAAYATQSAEDRAHMDRILGNMVPEMEFYRKSIKRIQRVKASPPNPANKGTFNSVQLTEYLTHSVKDRQGGEIAWMWFVAKNDVSFYTKDIMRDQCKSWKKLIKEGKVHPVSEEFNASPIVGGKQFHTFCICPTDTELIDPTGFGWEDGGAVIKGFIVYFKNKENRDALFNYLK
jgi:hypothetical protein